MDSARVLLPEIHRGKNSGNFNRIYNILYSPKFVFAILIQTKIHMVTANQTG